MEGARDGDGTGALAFSVCPLSGGGHAVKFAPANYSAMASYLGAALGSLLMR
jgi:hypothetical protein